jgi:hypothetical protein
VGLLEPHGGHRGRDGQPLRRERWRSGRIEPSMT